MRRIPSRELAPQRKVEHLREKLEKYASEHGLFLNPLSEPKIQWMSEHEGRCFCDWEKRLCPCQFVMEDLHRFNGICHCGVLCTKEKLEYFLAPKKPRKELTPEEKAARKQAMKEKQKQNELLLKKILKK